MKTLFNMTTDPYDLARYASAEDFRTMLQGFDGVELMVCGEDRDGIIPPEKIIGLHMVCPPNWIDLWRGDRKSLLYEFDTEENVARTFGGTTPDALLSHYRNEICLAENMGAEYMVFHVADCSAREVLTGHYRHSDAEVIDETCSLLNALLPRDYSGPRLMLENLWHPGLTLLSPGNTRRLLDGLHCPSKGIMLDTGHLMHTNPHLRTQSEAVTYIHGILDRHAGIEDCIAGVHLNASLSGTALRRLAAHPPVPAATYAERSMQLFTAVFDIDRHRPFIAEGVRALLERIAPETVTFEFISPNRTAHRRMLTRQRRALQ